MSLHLEIRRAIAKTNDFPEPLSPTIPKKIVWTELKNVLSPLRPYTL